METEDTSRIFKFLIQFYDDCGRLKEKSDEIYNCNDLREAYRGFGQNPTRGKTGQRLEPMSNLGKSSPKVIGSTERAPEAHAIRVVYHEGNRMRVHLFLRHKRPSEGEVKAGELADSKSILSSIIISRRVSNVKA